VDAGKKCEAKHCVKIAGKFCKPRRDDFNVGELLGGREMIRLCRRLLMSKITVDQIGDEFTLKGAIFEFIDSNFLITLNKIFFD
jgi:hypothetical protein